METIRKVMLLTSAVIAISCAGLKREVATTRYRYRPVDIELHKTILGLDSAFFEAYNSCDKNLQDYSNFYSDSVEFFHDQGGLTTSKNDIVEATRKNICGKVSRALVTGSVEVYPIRGYGAVEIGLHKFTNKTEEKTAPSKASKFIIMWKNAGSEWKITKVISLH